MRADTERKDTMRKRFAIVIGVAASGALVAAGASADFRSVHDPRGDTKCYHEHEDNRIPCSDSVKRAADIVEATAGHEGGRLKHTIRVVGKIHGGALIINTDSDPECEFSTLGAGRGEGKAKIRACPRGSNGTIGRARYDFHLHSVEISFSKESIGSPEHYGWWAFAFAGPLRGHATDGVPTRDHGAPVDGYIPHRLG